ncbi:MAG: NUDIX domain-containing protein [Patescibacteria group bacterium]
MKKEKLDRPKVGVGVYILNNKKELLLMKRKGSHGEGTWCPPGGHLEYNETFEKCAKRETKEEVGVAIKDIQLMGVTNDISRDNHYITVAMSAKIKSGKPKICELDKCTEFGWFKLNHLPSPLFLPVKNFLKNYKL